MSVFLNTLLVKMMMCLWYYRSIEICGTVWRCFYFSSYHRQSKHNWLRSTCNMVNCQVHGLTVCQSLILLSHLCCVCTAYFLVMGRECVFSLCVFSISKRSSFSKSSTGTITINFLEPWYWIQADARNSLAGASGVTRKCWLKTSCWNFCTVCTWSLQLRS